MSFGTSGFGVTPFGSAEVVTSSGSATNLVIQDATHGHAADNLTLDTVSSTTLVVQDATHGHSAESCNVFLAASITLTDLQSNRIYQRNGTSTAVTVSGTYTGAPTAIEARIVQHGTSTQVVTWTTIDAAPSAGAFSGAITVPQGGQYNVQVRFASDVGVVSNGTNPFGVGILALLVGQSQLVNWFDVGVHSAVTGAYRQSGSVYGGSSGSWAAMPTTGNGANEFAAQLIAQYGCPVGMLGYAVGGTLISQWDQSTDTYPRNAIKAVTDSGGAVEYILWAQGEADGSSGTAQATYETALTNVIANFRAQITNRSTKANLPVLVSMLGRGTAIGTDAQASAIRAAQFAIAGSVADVYVGAETLDLPLADTVHYSSAGYVTHGKRMAQTVKYLLGDATYHRGPYMVSAAVVDATTTDVTISHRGGTDFTPTSAIVGFEIDDGGSIVVPSAAVRQSATVVRLTNAALSSGSPTVRYGYGADGGDTYAATISNVLLDNTALALPLEQNADVAISAAVSLTLADAIHAHTASNLALSTSTLLTVANAVHAHIADSLLLSTNDSVWLTVEDATHGHSADNFTLPVDVWLTIADATHVHLADNTTLSTSAGGGVTLTPDDIAAIVAAVLAALNATTIPVDVQKMNGADVIGTGLVGDAWRGVGVPT